MSETLQKLMMLNQMNQANPDAYAMNPKQRANAQGDALIRLGAELGNPMHTGSGIDRTLTALNAGLLPALDAYNAQEQNAISQNATAAEMQRRMNMDILREDREKERMRKQEERENRREAIGREKLNFLKDTASGRLTPEMRRWNSMPANAKSEQIALGVGMGIPIDEVVKRLSEGESLREMAESRGLDLEKDVEPVYSPTQSNISGQKTQEAAGAELDFLETKTTEALKGYSRKIFGYSPSQITDAITNKNPDAQARFLAARAIQPEIAGARTRLLGGSNAHEALAEMQRSALGSINIYESLVSPEVYAKTQEYINLWLKQALEERGKNLYNVNKKREISARKQGEEGKYYQGKIRLNKNDQSLSNVRIPESELEEFLKDGGLLDEE